MSMKLKLTTLINVFIGFLLVVLGGVGGYGYAINGSLPLGIKLPYPVVKQLSGSQGGALSNLTGDFKSPDNSKVDFNVFWEVWSLLENNYVDPKVIDSKKMVDGAVGGMTAALGDPYTIYLPPKDNQRAAESLSGSFYGVGIELGYTDETLSVVSPLKGTPADNAGVKAGDLILRVKDENKDLDEDTQGWTLDEAVNKIRGKKNTTVTLTLWRDDYGDKSFEIDITRGEIVVESVELEFVENDSKKYAHLSISSFGERTVSEWDTAVFQILKENDLAGIILDLRNNPGGFLDSSVDIASDFIKSGVVISKKGRISSQDYPANGEARLKDIPLVVLVNRGSASASEILAGSLRDNLGVKLIGETTYGKGTVQDRIGLSNGGGLHVTIARWLLPDGDWIQDEGIIVDVEVKGDYETEEDEVLIKSFGEF